MKLPVKQLEAGMEVAKDVVRDDVVLLAAGSRLTPQILRALSVWEIEAVHVADPKATSAGGGASTEPGRAGSLGGDRLEQAAQAYTDKRFRHVPLDQPAVKRIRDLAAKRAYERLSRQSRPGGGSGS